MRTSVDTEFVVAATDVLDERVTTNDRARGLVAFEATHRTEPRFQATVISFDPIVRILIHVGAVAF